MDDEGKPTGEFEVKKDLFVYSTKRNTLVMFVLVLLFLVVNPIFYWPHFFLTHSHYPYPLLLIFFKIFILYCEVPCGTAALVYCISFNMKRAPAVDKIGDAAKIEDADPDFGDPTDYGYFDEDGGFHWFDEEEDEADLLQKNQKNEQEAGGEKAGKAA